MPCFIGLVRQSEVDDHTALPARSLYVISSGRRMNWAIPNPTLSIRLDQQGIMPNPKREYSVLPTPAYEGAWAGSLSTKELPSNPL
jgi:hypothetical protein